jgi:hypothetical protein
METTDYIITRYKEYIDWIQYIPLNVNKIYIYNKGPDDDIFKNYIPDEEMLKKLVITKEKNIGRIDHTLVNHILLHWDCLPNILVNLPGTVLMSEKKGRYFSSINRSLKSLKTYYKGFYSPRFKKVVSNFNYNINNYEPEGICNRNNGNTFIKSEYLDFQAWKTAIIDSRPIKYVCIRCMFAVCKENIKYIDKEIYERLLQSLSVGDNIENGHFAERIWAHLFRQYSFDQLTPSTGNSTNTVGGVN